MSAGYSKNIYTVLSESTKLRNNQNLSSLNLTNQTRNNQYFYQTQNNVKKSAHDAKGGQFLDQLNDYQLLKKKSTPWCKVGKFYCILLWFFLFMILSVQPDDGYLWPKYVAGLHTNEVVVGL